MDRFGLITLVYAGLLVAIGVTLLLRPKALAKLLLQVVNEPWAIFSFGIWTTILGLVVVGVTYPPVWQGTLWVLPLLGWLTLLKGLWLLWLPGSISGTAKAVTKSTGWLMFAGLVSCVIGIWLFFLIK